MKSRVAAVAISVIAAAATAWALDAELKREAKDADPAKRAEAARALGRDGSAEAAHVLADMFSDRDAGVRDAAVIACGGVKDAAAAKALASAAKSTDDLTRRNCAEALGRTRSDAALATLELLAADGSPQVRADALDALWNFAGDVKAAGIAKSAAGDRDPTVRAAAIEAVGRIGGAGAMDVLQKALADTDDGVRCVACAAFRTFAPANALTGLPGAAMDASWRVRAQCVDDAAALRKSEAVDLLVELVGDKTTRVSAAAHRALQTLSGKEIGRDLGLWAAWWETNRATWRASWTDPPAADRDAPDDPKKTSAQYHGLDVATDAAVFVADLSGSMKEPTGGGDSRSRWAVAAEELRRTLAALPESFVTNLVFFQQEPREAFAKPQPLTKATRDKAAAFIASGSPAHEGDLLGGVLAALSQDGVDTVFVLSDGSPSAGDMVDRGRVRAAIRQRNRTRKFVIDAIGFGARKAVERGFMEGIARDSGGRAVFRGDGAK